MNNVQLSGNLVKDIELRQSPSGKAYAKFTLGSRKDKDHTDFISCVAWGKTAELIAQYFGHKGDFIVISNGSITTGSYEGKNGKVFTTEVLVNNIDFYPTEKKVKKDERHSPSEPNLLDVPAQVTDFFKGTGLEVEKELDLSPDALPFY